MRRRVAAVVALALALAGCGGGSGDSGPRTAAPDPDDVRRAQAYVRDMRPAVDRIGAVLLAIDHRRHRRDFELGLGLLKERKRLDDAVPDGALLLEHDRLEQAIARGATLLIAKPGSPYARTVRRDGLRVGSVATTAVVAGALASWAGAVERRFEDLGARAPRWVSDERAVMERFARDASARLRRD